jgi:hypothetical protein
MCVAVAGVRWWVAQTSPLAGLRGDGMMHLELGRSRVRSCGKARPVGVVGDVPHNRRAPGGGGLGSGAAPAKVRFVWCV